MVAQDFGFRAPGNGDTTFLVIGYGTLLYRASVGNTIGRAAAEQQEMVPVLARGFRRLFNLRPDHYEASNIWGRPGIENAAMNVEPAAEECFNGLAFQVTADELEKLDERERYYQRLTVQAHDFFTGAPLGPAHIYSSKQDARWIEQDPTKLLPLWRDIQWARAGAYAIGQDFGKTFDRTTYLADGKTLVADHYRDHLLSDDPLNEPPS